MNPRIGLGCEGLTGKSGEKTSVATLHAATNSGITLLDTGDFYGMGSNEAFLGRHLGDRENTVLSVKFGGLRDPNGNFVGIEGRPAHVKASLAYSLQRLNTDHVDVYRPARLDPAVPIEDTIGAIAEMVQAGYVRRIGLSEVGAETIRRAHAVHPIVDLQIEYSLFSRSIETNGILETCRELGIGITAYGVLAHGLLTGSYRPTGQPPFHLPWFHEENLATNLALVDALRTIADTKGVSVAQLAIAWVLAQGEDIVPLVGASRPERIPEAVAAAELHLSDDDLAAIAAAVPPSAVAGTRYAAPLMRLLDSER
ncbi:aldo/keto reductase [Cryptosporangium sp. NPDC048952]|uniref:aldo/keto reductase n=1 Tax=Cryptosporangium sp. NPDC048952 TaxID=3363961 RepID=UPI003723D2D2